MDRFDPFVKYADVYGDIINWEKDPMNKPQNQNKYFFSDGKTYYEQICKMLRLMSVFKEAFNQIYSNEDEISEAWENFVNNLSASVVEGSEPDVTLTWTDDSVNFEFTMVPGVPGEQGVGITSISFNSDYTMTITLSDGNTYTSMSLKGETGPQGPQGETGSGLQILDVYATLADLQSAHPTGQPGDAYQVGSAGNYILYIWSSSQSAWVQAGTLGTVSPYTSAPLMNGTASAGSQNLYARGDHVHPSDTSRASKEELDALIKTSQSMIDQSFTYRESPAIQNSLARIDKIKGNTLVWNQLQKATANTSTVNGITYTNNGDGSWTVSGTATASAQKALTISADWITAISGHKYLMVGGLPNGGSSKWLMQLYKNNANTLVGTDSGNGLIYTADDTTVNLSIYFTVYNGNTVNGKIYPQIFDLTKMGLDSITSVSEFLSLFPLYYSYESGKLLSFNGTGIKTVGFNQWDEEWEVGAITAQGTPSVTADRIRSKNFIPAEPNTRYYRKTPNNLQPFFYDENQQFIEYGLWGVGNFTAPSNCAYMKFQVDPVYGLTYKNDICINISNTDLNGTYEPYKESSSSLPISQYFSTGMKSTPSAYDELTNSNSITRIGMVDLGTLTYIKEGAASGHPDWPIFFANVPGALGRYGAYGNTQICAKYSNRASSTWQDKEIGFGSNTTNINIADTAFIDYTVDQVKQALSGVMLYYELATPVETAVDLDLDFMAYENGTEQLLPVNGSVPSTSPIIADMTYLSIDDAMEYVHEKLANVPLNTQQRLEGLEDDVADLQTDVGALQPAVSALQTSVGNINTNIGQLSSTVAGHTASISDMQSDITDLNTGLSNLEDTVTDNTSRIGTLESGLSTTNGNVQNLSTSVSDLDDTLTAQGATVTALDSIIQDISNNPVISSLGSHELGFVAAYVSATLPANTGTRVTIPKPTIFPNNYTPLFIVGMSTGSYNVSICEIPPTFGNRDSVNCRVWNHGSEQTTQITVYILCMRQRQSQ